MVHLWQHHHGKPGRGRYHNREWAEKMKAIGLIPTDTGRDGGKETGESVRHMIAPDGPLTRAVNKLLTKGFEVTWSDNEEEDAAAAPDGAKRRKSKSGVRVKFTCPVCGLNAWARHDAKLACGEHNAAMQAQADGHAED